MRCRFLAVLPLMLFAACSAKTHPIAGTWTQETGTDATGANFMIDPTATKVHAHPAGGGHFDGTCTYDDAAKTVTLKCKLMGDGKSDAWTGKVDGEHLELTSPDGKMKFHHGGADPHGR